jgi:hypothetical protein
MPISRRNWAFPARKAAGTTKCSLNRPNDCSRKAGQKSGSNRVRFEVEDLFETDLHDATVVTLYSIPAMNVRLRPKLLNELKAGSGIVSHNFDMGDWSSDKEEEVDGQKIYLWTIRDRR